MAGVGLISLVVWEWFAKYPIIDVRLFKNFNFLSSNVMMFLLGVVFFSSLVMIPQFLQTLLGYTAEIAGYVLSISAILLLVEMPIIGVLSSKFQARRLIAVGWFAMAAGMFYSTKQFGLFMDFWTATRVRTAQVVGLGFLFVPITLVAYVGIPAAKSNAVSGMVNFMRNIGSGVGTSIVTTMIARRSQYHQTILIGNVTPDNPVSLNTINGLTQKLTQAGLSPDQALNQAHARVYQAVQGEAATLAYIDTFWFLGVAAAIMFILTFFLKKNEPGKAEAGAAG